jgi:hypothetical protein
LINFRYHLISLTAVFLALTVGLILGTAALNGPAMQVFEANSQSLRDSNNALRDEIAALEDELRDDQSFASEIAPSYLEGRLAGHAVLIVAMPGAETDVVDGVEEMLGLAGAASAGRVSILDDFLDPANNDQLANLVDGVTPDTVEAPVTYDGVTAVSAVLAAVTTGHFEGAAVEITPADITTVTTGLAELGMLTVETEPTGGATGVVLVGGSAATDSNAEERNTGVVSVAGGSGGGVDGGGVHGERAGGGNPVLTLRGEENEAPVSTVDNVLLAQGQIAAVIALADLIADGGVHHLGTGEGAEGQLPGAA